METAAAGSGLRCSPALLRPPSFLLSGQRARLRACFPKHALRVPRASGLLPQRALCEYTACACWLGAVHCCFSFAPAGTVPCKPALVKFSPGGTVPCKPALVKFSFPLNFGSVSPPLPALRVFFSLNCDSCCLNPVALLLAHPSVRRIGSECCKSELQDFPCVHSPSLCFTRDLLKCLLPSRVVGFDLSFLSDLLFANHVE